MFLPVFQLLTNKKLFFSQREREPRGSCAGGFVKSKEKESFGAGGWVFRESFCVEKDRKGFVLCLRKIYGFSVFCVIVVYINCWLYGIPIIVMLYLC